MKKCFITCSCLFMIFLIFSMCQEEEKKTSIKNNESEHFVGSNEIIVDLDTFFRGRPLDTINLKFDFETKKKNKRFQGLSSKYIFLQLIEQYQIDTATCEALFICKDGYKAKVPFYQLLNEKGFVANRDIDARLQWDDEINDKFSPFYLVWDLEFDDHNHSFPYGIIKIKIIDKNQEFANAYPTSAPPPIRKGFEIFIEKCMKCHSINKSGGQVGPDLNIPKNVTEYWKIEHLNGFIKNPSSYRYNSKMPTIPELNDEQIQLIIEYLTFMSTHKINY